MIPPSRRIRAGPYLSVFLHLRDSIRLSVECDVFDRMWSGSRTWSINRHILNIWGLMFLYLRWHYRINSSHSRARSNVCRILNLMAIAQQQASHGRFNALLRFNVQGFYLSVFLDLRDSIAFLDTLVHVECNINCSSSIVDSVTWILSMLFHLLDFMAGIEPRSNVWRNWSLLDRSMDMNSLQSG